MANRVLLNNIDHHQLKVLRRYAPEHGHGVSHSLIVPAEFEEVQREYPIFFRTDSDGQLQVVALLGLEKSENLFLDGQDWKARYVPAVQRRGPFFISVAETGESSIYIDLDDGRVGAIAGEPLFKEHGGNAPLLEQVDRDLHLVHQGLREAWTMFQLLGDMNLIEPVQVNIDLGDGLTIKVPDLLTISADRFTELRSDELGRLRDSNFLTAAVFVLSSLGNVSRLIELKNRRRHLQ